MAEYLPDRPKLSENDLEQYLKTLADDQVWEHSILCIIHALYMMCICNVMQAHFIRKTDDSGGGGYSVGTFDAVALHIL